MLITDCGESEGGLSLPPDIAGRRFTWIRERSQAWTEEPLRDQIRIFIEAFEAEHDWVRPGSMVVEEKFHTTNVNVKVPLGPTGPPQRRDNFLQRDGIPTIIVSCTRDRDSRGFEVGLPFALANDTPSTVVEVLLDSARLSLRAAEKESR